MMYQKVFKRLIDLILSACGTKTAPNAPEETAVL